MTGPGDHLLDSDGGEWVIDDQGEPVPISRVIALEVRYGPELARALGIFEVDVVCLHGSTAPGDAGQVVHTLHAERGAETPPTWQVRMDNASYVVRNDESEVDVMPTTWAAAAEEIDNNGMRRRFRFICPTCDRDVPIRAENLNAIVSRLADLDASVALELGWLSRALEQGHVKT